MTKYQRGFWWGVALLAMWAIAGFLLGVAYSDPLWALILRWRP